jgi:hypothetical protein
MSWAHVAGQATKCVLLQDLVEWLSWSWHWPSIYWRHSLCYSPCQYKRLSMDSIWHCRTVLVYLAVFSV